MLIHSDLHLDTVYSNFDFESSQQISYAISNTMHRNMNLDETVTKTTYGHPIGTINRYLHNFLYIISCYHLMFMDISLFIFFYNELFLSRVYEYIAWYHAGVLFQIQS